LFNNIYSIVNDYFVGILYKKTIVTQSIKDAHNIDIVKKMNKNPYAEERSHY